MSYKLLAAGTFTTSTEATTNCYAVINAYTKQVESGWPALGNATAAYHVAASPDATKIAVIHNATNINKLSVIDVDTKTIESGWPNLSGNTGGDGWVTWSPDGSMLAVSDPSSPFYKIINTSTKAEITGLPAIAALARGLSFSPDNLKLALCFVGNPVYKVLDIDSKTLETGWGGISGIAATGIAYNPAGTKLVVSRHNDPRWDVVDVSSKAVESGWPSLDGNLYDPSFSPDGARVALPHNFGDRLSVVDMSTKTIESGWPILSSGDQSRAGAWSPDGAWLAVGIAGGAGLKMIYTSTKSVDTSWPTLDAISGVAWLGEPVDTNYKQLITDAAPVAYWTLDETSGTTATDEMGNHNGTYEGSPVLGESPAITAGTSVDFGAGHTNKVEIDHHADFSGLPTLTLECWFKLNAFANTAGVVIGKAVSGSDAEWYMGVGDGFLRFAHVTPSSTRTDSDVSQSIDLDTWYHYVITLSGGTVSFYLDGELIDTASVGSGTRSFNTPVWLGGYAGTSSNFVFNGFIDEVAIYDYALTPTEIEYHYDVGVGNEVYDPITDAEIEPTAGSLTFNANAPEVEIITEVDAPVARMELNGFEPTVDTVYNVEVDVTDAATLAFQGGEAFLTDVVIVDTDAPPKITFNTHAPTVDVFNFIPKFMGWTTSLNLNNLESNMGEVIRPGDLLITIGTRTGPVGDINITNPDNTTQFVMAQYPAGTGQSSVRLQGAYKVAHGTKAVDEFTGNSSPSQGWRLLCIRHLDPTKSISTQAGDWKAELSTSIATGAELTNGRIWVGWTSNSSAGYKPPPEMTVVERSDNWRIGWENPDVSGPRQAHTIVPAGPHRIFMTNFRARDTAYVQNEEIQVPLATVSLSGLQPSVGTADLPVIGAPGRIQLQAKRPDVFPPHLTSDQLYTNFNEHPNGTGLPHNWSEIIAIPVRWTNWSVADSSLSNSKWLTISQQGSGVLYEARWDAVGESLQDVEAYVRFFVRNTNAPLIWLRGKGHNTAGYFVWWGLGQFGLNYYDGTNDFTLAETSGNLNTFSGYRLRFRMEGNLILARFWADGVAEPSGWQLSTNHSGIASGHFSVSGWSPNWAIDEVGIGLNGTEAPTTAPPVEIDANKGLFTLSGLEPEVVASSTIVPTARIELVGKPASVIPARPEANTLFVGSSVQPYLRVIDLDFQALDQDWPSLPGSGIDGAFNNNHAAIVHDQANQLTVIDISDKVVVGGYPALSAEPWAVAASETFIATGTRKHTSNSNFGTNAGNIIPNTLRIININTKEMLAFPTVNSTIFALAFSPTGERLAIGCAEAPYFRVLNFTTGQFQGNWEQPGSMITDIEWRDEHLYVSGPGGVHRYDTDTREIADKLLDDNVWAISLSADNERLAAVGDNYYVINTQTQAVSGLTNPQLQQALGKSVAWISDTDIAIGFLWYDSNNREGVFYDTVSNNILVDYPEIEGTTYFLGGGVVDSATGAPVDTILEPGVGRFSFHGRTPVVEVLTQIDSPVATIEFNALTPEVEAATQNIEINANTATIGFTAQLPTVTPVTGFVFPDTGRLTLTGRRPTITAESTDMVVKLVPSSDTSLTARDATEFDDIDLGLVFYGGTKGTSFRVANTTSKSEQFIVFATSANQVLVDGVEFSLDGRVWDAAVLAKVAPNRLSDIIYVRITVPGGAAIGDSTFLINAEGGISI